MLQHLFGEFSFTALFILLADDIVRLGLAVRVIMRRRPVGTTLAWLAIVLIFPFVGALIYLLFGELRLGYRRARIAERIHGPYLRWLDNLRARSEPDWKDVGTSGTAPALARLGEAVGGIPAQEGNTCELLTDAQEFFDRLIADIDAAERTCHLEFYIWGEGGTANQVADALIRAAARGVTCRVLMDAVGSVSFLRSSAVQRLRSAGVEVTAAMPVNLFRMLFVRFDLRLHRKIVVIDGEIAYTGSQNMVDPRYFKKGAGVGEWVDAMIRIRGPVVEALAITFLEDWELETGTGLDKLAQTSDARALKPEGSVILQAIPSGPLVNQESIQSLLLMTIYQARRELIMTTPYFVPDDILVTALKSAAYRGVDVTLILPARVDSRLARFASRAHLEDLLIAGVNVAQFTDGLLHTKSVTIDGRIALFGSLNLDPRSLVLNFEITVAIYDQPLTNQLRTLQQTYLQRSTLLNLPTWTTRPRTTRFLENLARLMSPLL